MMPTVVWILPLALKMPPPPWRDPRIHNFGNHGLGGAIHAAVAPFATRAIDRLAYKGYDVRQLLRSDTLTSTVDLGCGTGVSTSASGIGVDASREMLVVARACNPNATFHRGLAEKWGEADAYTRVTCSFVLHEQPKARRVRILKNAYRISNDHVMIMDIHPSYKPSFMMKTGEPFVEDYLRHIEEEIDDLFGDRVVTTTHCDERVVLFRITKTR